MRVGGRLEGRGRPHPQSSSSWHQARFNPIFCIGCHNFVLCYFAFKIKTNIFFVFPQLFMAHVSLYSYHIFVQSCIWLKNKACKQLSIKLDFSWWSGKFLSHVLLEHCGLLLLGEGAPEIFGLCLLGRTLSWLQVLQSSIYCLPRRKIFGFCLLERPIMITGTLPSAVLRNRCRCCSRSSLSSLFVLSPNNSLYNVFFPLYSVFIQECFSSLMPHWTMIAAQSVFLRCALLSCVSWDL